MAINTSKALLFSFPSKRSNIKHKPLYIDNLSMIKPELSLRTKIENFMLKKEIERFQNSFYSYRNKHKHGSPLSQHNFPLLTKLKLQIDALGINYASPKIKKRNALLELKPSQCVSSYLNELYNKSQMVNAHNDTTKSIHKDPPMYINKFNYANNSTGKIGRYGNKKVEKSRSVIDMLENKFIKHKLLENKFKMKDKSISHVDVRFKEKKCFNCYSSDNIIGNIWVKESNSRNCIKRQEDNKVDVTNSEEEYNNGNVRLTSKMFKT